MQRFIKIISVLLFLFLMGCSISVDVETLDFGSTETIKTFNLEVVGGVKWTINASEDWVTATPSQGRRTQLVYVSVDREGLEEGNYEALLSIENNLNRDTQVIMVTMTVEEGGQTTTTSTGPTTTTTEPTTTSTTTPIEPGKWDSIKWDVDKWGD
jgi:hypothetical protein